MRTIKISRLVLENFKCHRHLELVLDGKNVSIYGDNATGKTSVYDALTWLLFGKDSAGNGDKNIEIKPLNADGDVADHSAITSVEAEFLVDGESTTYRRTYQEVWSTRRGSTEAVYSGNTSEYFVDGVPCKKYAFEAKIEEMVSEYTFRLLTTVSYFPQGLKWQDRRAILFDMAGTLTDREIMETDATFAPLLESMGKLSLTDYKAKLAAEKRGFAGVRDQTPARLDECQKAVQDLAKVNFDEARAKVTELEQRQNDLSTQIIAVDHGSEADAKRLEIRESQLELENLIVENNAFRAQQSTGAPDVDALRQRRRYLDNRLTNYNALLDATIKSCEDCEAKIQKSRDRWIAVNSEAFTGGTCPTCGQQLPFDQLQSATATFEARKRERLDEIVRTGESLKETQAQTKERIVDLLKEIDALTAEIRQMDKRILTAEESKVEIVDMEGYAESLAALQEKIGRQKIELDRILSNSNGTKNVLGAEMQAVRAALKEARDTVAKESVLEYNRNRIRQLQEDAKNATQALESIEKMLYLADEYTRYKTRFVEDGVNSLFHMARFRLFREQANGGVEERCDVVCDGVPYTSLNNGAKINVGIDIINALSRHYGVTVPLFVDNAESVTRLENCDTQVIRLVVSENDKELRLAYES